MAEYINMNAYLIISNQVLKLIIKWLIVSAPAMVVSNTFADTLNDPTQPPAAFYNQTHNGDGSDPFSGPVLQSIILGSNYRAAIISGQKVILGGKYEGATLIRLNESEVVLRNPDNSLQKLTIDYQIDKKILPNKNQVIPSNKKSQSK